MVILPDQYITEKFCQYSGYPKYNKRAKAWMAGCPICREGSSWGKKRRLYYKLEKNYIFCFNCGWKSNSLRFIQHVTGMSLPEITLESTNYSSDNVTKVLEQPEKHIQRELPSLPDDSINLFEESGKLLVVFWYTTGKKSSFRCNILNTCQIFEQSYQQTKDIVVEFNRLHTQEPYSYTIL